MLLSIGMIVKNEERYLRRCLEGLKPILDNVRSELIIYDTGSTDNTFDIAKEFTDKVYQIKWRNDFAWARNCTIDRAIGKWYMAIDADEIFTDVTEIIDFFNSGEYKNYEGASYTLRNIHNSSVTEMEAFRLWKMDKHTRYVGKIHESIQRKSPAKFLNAVCEHYGYFYETDEVLKGKIDRNLAPLLEEYEAENPKKLRTIHLLVQEYRRLTKLDMPEASELEEKFIKEGIELCGRDQSNRYYHAFAMHWTEFLWYRKEYEKIVEFAKDYFSDLTVHKELMLMMASINANALAMLKRHEEAARVYLYCYRVYEEFKAGKLESDTGELKPIHTSLLGNGEFHIFGASACLLLAGQFEAAWNLCKNFYQKSNVYASFVKEVLQDGNYDALADLIHFGMKDGVGADARLLILASIKSCDTDAEVGGVFEKALTENPRLKEAYEMVTRSTQGDKKISLNFDNIRSEQKVLLSVGMIVKNEEKYLRRCLEGLAPILRSVKSELIIYDTGSTDGTLEIAKEFTDKVYQIQWRDDFAWARNHTIDKAVGEWYMFVDADEVFIDTADIIEFFDSGECKNYNAASYRLINVSKGSSTETRVVRFRKIDADTRFVGKIHEGIPIKMPIKELDSLCEHYGYFYETDEILKEKTERNLKPLLEEYKAQNTKEKRTIHLLVNEYRRMRSMTEDALDFEEKFIKEGMELCGSDQTDIYYHTFAMHWVEYLWTKKEYSQLVDFVESYFSDLVAVDEMVIMMRCVQADALFALKRYAEAAESHLKAYRIYEDIKAGKLLRILSNTKPIHAHLLESGERHIWGAIRSYLWAGEFGNAWKLSKNFDKKSNLYIEFVKGMLQDGHYDTLADLLSFGCSDEAGLDASKLIFDSVKICIVGEEYAKIFDKALLENSNLKNAFEIAADKLSSDESEMDLITKQIAELKENINILIDNGDAESALLLLEAYSQMRSDDPDIVQIRQKIDGGQV